MECKIKMPQQQLERPSSTRHHQSRRMERAKTNSNSNNYWPQPNTRWWVNQELKATSCHSKVKLLKISQPNRSSSSCKTLPITLSKEKKENQTSMRMANQFQSSLRKFSSSFNKYSKRECCNSSNNSSSCSSSSRWWAIRPSSASVLDRMITVCKQIKTSTTFWLKAWAKQKLA